MVTAKKTVCAKLWLDVMFHQFLFLIVLAFVCYGGGMYSMPEKPDNTEMYISSYQEYSCVKLCSISSFLWLFG